MFIVQELGYKSDVHSTLLNYPNLRAIQARSCIIIPLQRAIIFSFKLDFTIFNENITLALIVYDLCTLTVEMVLSSYRKSLNLSFSDQITYKFSILYVPGYVTLSLLWLIAI